MMLMKTIERINGAHPPCGTLIIDAEIYKVSMDPKKRRKHNARKMLRRHTIMITKVVKHVVTSITVITARPA
jgi:pyrimidine deaminase RibD-like protein